MKKLSLKKLKLGSEDLLQREQLKTVFGGYGGGGGADGQTCHFTYTLIPGGNSYSASSSGWADGVQGSRDANDYCVEAILDGLFSSCGYNCEWDD